MPQIACIQHVTEIEQGNGWVDSAKFASRERLVDAYGTGTTKLPALRSDSFKIISKKEYHFSPVERVGRALLGVVAPDIDIMHHREYGEINVSFVSLSQLTRVFKENITIT